MENDGLKLGLYRAGITGIFQQLKPSAGRLYSLSMDTNRVAVVLVAPEEVSVLRIKQIISQLKLSFDQKVCTLPFECILSHGDICSSLLDLHSSYRESIQKIHMRTYGSGVEADSQPENGSQCVYQQVVSQIMQNMLDGGKDVAARRLDLVVSDIMASRSSLDVKKKNCEYLLEVLLGKVMEIQVDSEADICWDNGWSFSKTEIEGFDTEQEIELYTRCLLYTSFHSVKAVVPGMKEQGYGRIVLVSSLGGRTGRPGVGVNYAASKAGVVGMTMLLGYELGPWNITVNSVAPGPLKGKMFSSMTKENIERLQSGTRIPRLGEMDEIAAAIAFLASDESGWTTGEVLDINGGLQY